MLAPSVALVMATEHCVLGKRAARVTELPYLTSLRFRIATQLGAQIVPVGLSKGQLPFEVA